MSSTRKVLYHTKYLDLVEIDDGSGSPYYAVTRPNAPDGAVVVYPITEEGELIFIRQPRKTIDAFALEFPAGLRDESKETALETAKRELLEETGCVAVEWIPVVGDTKGLTVSVGLSDERLVSFLARGARKVTEPLTNEGTIPVYVPLDEAWDWLHERVSSGEEVDYKLFGAVCLIERMMRDVQLP